LVSGIPPPWFGFTFFPFTTKYVRKRKRAHSRQQAASHKQHSKLLAS
jgi:hypothetical protein